MAKRMILMLIVMLALLSSLGFMKFRQISSAVQAASHFQPPPEAVTSIVAHRETWPATMGVIGTMEAVHGVTVSADLPGTVEKISFESGQFVHEGDVLVELDTRQERAQLAALEATSSGLYGRKFCRKNPNASSVSPASPNHSFFRFIASVLSSRQALACAC